MAKDRITITLPDALLTQIDEMSKDSGLNRSQQIEKLIETALTTDAADGFYKSVELRGGGEECMMMVRSLTSENSSTKFDLDREWIVRFLVKLNPGDKPYGGMVMRGAKATASPTMDPRLKKEASIDEMIEAARAAEKPKQENKRTSKK